MLRGSGSLNSYGEQCLPEGLGAQTDMRGSQGAGEKDNLCLLELLSLGQLLIFGGPFPFCLWNTFTPLFFPSQASQVQLLPLNLKRKMKRDYKDRWQLPFSWILLFSERNFQGGSLLNTSCPLKDLISQGTHLWCDILKILLFDVGEHPGLEPYFPVLLSWLIKLT